MADQLNIEGRPQRAKAYGKDNEETTEDNVYVSSKAAEELVLPEALEELLALKEQRMAGMKSTGWTKPEELDKSLDLDIYDDLNEVAIKEGTKHDEMDKSLDLDIYDDLDDFQKAEDRKTKELLAWEVKHAKALIEIESLKAENKALGKKIKAMEVNLQNLLDTAKSEVKRKESLIAQLRKEKDDICFRRKRGREVEEPGERCPESKRSKESQPKTVAKKDLETDRNPFKTASKEGTKKSGTKEDVKKLVVKDDLKKTSTREDPKKSHRRSKSPKLVQSKTNERRSSTHTRREEDRQRSRDRRHSRSRSPRHSTRRDHHRSRDSSARHHRRRSRSQSPRIQLAVEKHHTMTTLFGDETNDQPSESPPLELAKMATELQPSRKVLTKQIDHASDLYVISSREQPKDVTAGLFAEVCTLQQELIPGLDIISQPETVDLVHNKVELNEEETKSLQKKINVLPTRSKGSAHGKLKETKLLGLNLDVPKDNGDSELLPANHSKPEVHQLDLLKSGKHSNEPQVEMDIKINNSHEPVEVQTDIIEDKIDNAVQTNTASVHTEKCSQLNEKASEDCVTPPDVGIRIIEDIRLPKIADIENIAVKVDKPCTDPTVIPNSESNEQNPGVDDHNLRLGELKEPSSSTDDTPTKSATVLYAKPDSTKVDHNDENDEVILEAAMNMLTSEQDSPRVADPTYPNLSIEEDAIEMALEQLHQQSPDETVVTSTSNRALQTPKQNLVSMLTQSPTQGSPLKSKTKLKLSPKGTPEKPSVEKTPLKKRKINMDSSTEAPLVPTLNLTTADEDVSMNETMGSSLGDDTSTVIKRCSLGNTDYQYEEIKGEIILRVKRRCRRRRPALADNTDR
ncbi:uncharacterized protein LOC108149107 [Drosophila elegans]|uniref:uncharacterized protein LOC108149107 n=1 Tax=Drosophila elegans TaxID=30023 RepID=UPI0007E7CF92|nr:uncharacterized protein LOC108149107 [Drosophila elegans]